MPSSPSQTLCPEKRLLVCCARTNAEPAIAEEIRKLAAGPLDWDCLLAEAAENSVTPLLARQLSACAGDLLAPTHLELLKEAARANAARSLMLVASLIRIMDAFRCEGIQAIPYKGPVLAAQAYGDVTLREFDDLDIILRHRDMPKANDIMVALGFRPKFPWTLSPGAASAPVPGEYNYHDEGRTLLVELHTELTLRHFPVTPDLDSFAQRLVPVALSGHEVGTFAPEDGLSILCIHGSKDFWQRISWIADIAEMVQSHRQLDWDQVFRCAASLHAERMLHLGLALAAELLAAPLPDAIFPRVRNDRTAASVASEVQSRLLSLASHRLVAAGRFRFRRRMLPGTIAGWRYAIRLAVVPAEEDWMILRLPRALSPLYFALRPLRLLRKYGS
ncbi:MAG TPA: nucleotidyltransferase family protein [Candidatus Polarisedimenticolia bacterium]|nr:nucleotidyltransferase family protein [Candidatus Polarisedimenticolia bacterium]